MQGKRKNQKLTIQLLECSIPPSPLSHKNPDKYISGTKRATGDCPVSKQRNFLGLNQISGWVKRPRALMIPNRVIDTVMRMKYFPCIHF